MPPHDDEKERLKRENAELLKERAKEAAKWRDSVADQFDEVWGRLDKMEGRISTFETFRTRSVAYMSGALGVVAVGWKFFDRWFK